MSAFPQELRDMASALELARMQYRGAISLPTEGEEMRIDQLICVEIAEKQLGAAKVAFDKALSTYMASERK